jgi:hypothetical protein
VCFDGSVGAARGFGEGAGCVVYISGFVFLITDNVAHCGQNRALSSLLAVCLCQRYDD